MKHILLSRDMFRQAVFTRDNHKCVFCGKPAVDAHHIMERRLWPDGGYYLANGASVCEEHHIQCEKTLISVEDVRIACGINSIIVPPHLYDDHQYDKWGNPVLQNGNRLRGELFFDESVQKILHDVIPQFVEYVKYPRTHHLSWSESVNEDDRVIQNMDRFIGKRVIVTEKMDGECSTLYRNYTHARSVDGRSHSTRDWLKQHWSQFSSDIPEGWRVCGENLYAKHSIQYDNLESFFMGFSVWNDTNICLSWDDTMEWFQLLGVQPVPVLYDGIYDETIIKNLWDPSKYDTSEGYVVRLADSFGYQDFRYCCAKYVRKNHVQTVKHWMHGQRIERNKMKD